MPVYRDSSNPDEWRLVFTLPDADDRRAVSVVGSFNDWTAGVHELRPDGRGGRSVTVAVPYDRPVYFRYLAEGGVWFDDPDADTITEHGGLLQPDTPPAPATTRPRSRAKATVAHSVAVAHVKDDRPAGGTAVLVDRIWPRGQAKDSAPWDEWLKAVAPSAALRKWYGHEPDKHAEFVRRYRAELDTGPQAEAFQHLQELHRAGRLTLLTATRNIALSQAQVLADLLNGGHASGRSSAGESPGAAGTSG